MADVRQITLKTWGSKAPTLLPEDLHYKVSCSSSHLLIGSEHTGVADLRTTTAICEVFKRKHICCDADGSPVPVPHGRVSNCYVLRHEE